MTSDTHTQLAQLVDELGRSAFAERHRGRPDRFDDSLWRRLEDSGLTRLTTAEGAGPAESALVLAGLARHACAVPVAETDLLASWLLVEAGLAVPGRGPLTVAVADARPHAGRLIGTARDIPWPRDAAVVLAARTPDAVHVALLGDAEPDVVENLAGEPRGTLTFDVPVNATGQAPAVADELIRRGAWARCVQTVGALDAALTLTVAHTRQRVQFGRPLSAFQAVQQSLAAMAGEIERARAATDLAVAAATDHGFATAATDYAVTVAKVAVGRAVAPVTTMAHQLHGAIGVTAEHPLWLMTTRARSWMNEFGSTSHHARRLGRMALAGDPWELAVGP